MSGQDKISRYAADGKGGYAAQVADRPPGPWRAGEARRDRRLHLYEPPINGLLSVIDNSRCGVLLYTEDGLYVETLFPAAPAAEVGIYALPGEFFQGIVYADRKDGSICIGAGKATPLVFKAEGWSLSRESGQHLTTLQRP